MNKSLIYLLICIVLIGSVSADLFTDKMIDDTKLVESFKTSNIEVIKDEIFIELKSSDSLKSEAVFSIDTSKIVEEKSLDIVFNEACGKVESYDVVWLKDNDYKVNANIKSEVCDDGSFGYKVDWMPKLTIGENILINQKWDWWNNTFDITNPNQYYLIIKATSFNLSAFNLYNVSVNQLSPNEFVVYENVSNNYEVSRARVWKILSYNSSNVARFSSQFMSGVSSIVTADVRDYDKFAYFTWVIPSGVAGSCIYNLTPSSLTGNPNVSTWWNTYDDGGGAYPYKWLVNGSLVSIARGYLGGDYTEQNTSANITNNPRYFQIDETYAGGTVSGVEAFFLINSSVTASVQSGCGAMFNNKGLINYNTSFGIPKTSLNQNLYNLFKVRFILYNNTISPYNISLSNGTYVYNFTSNGGILYTTLFNNNSQLWNISFKSLFYNLTFNNYNLSNSLDIDRRITQSLTASSGVFGESSNIVLNLSKGVNQSYNSVKLVYNGVTYSSPTQTEFSDYTLFTQSISNTAIGNFTYAWNVSLTDYGNVFNFTTVNGSHVVSGNNLSLRFFDSNSPLTLLNSVNISFNLIFSNSSNYSTSVGSYNFTNLSSGEYTVNSFASGFADNTKYVSLNSTNSNIINIYLLNISESTLFKILVRNQNDEVVSNVKVRLEQEFINGSLTECETDDDGKCYMYIVESATNKYRFIIIQNGVFIKTTSYAPIVTLGSEDKVITIRVDTGENLVEELQKQLNLYYDLTISGNITSFQFIDGGNDVLGGCLLTYKRFLPSGSFILVNTQCVSGLSGVISYNFTSLIGGVDVELSFGGFVNYTGYSQNVRSISKVFMNSSPISNRDENDYLLVTVIIYFIIAFITIWIDNIFVQIGINAGVMVVLNLLNFNLLGLSIMMGFLALGVFINWQRKTNRGQY